MKNYTIYTRSRSETLYNMMAEFLPKENLVRVTGFNGYEESVQYLFYIIENCKTEYIVNIDEDCFIYDFAEVEKIIADLEKFGLSHAGMSDYGACPHRNFKPETHNPFFNIINTKFAKKVLTQYDQVNDYFEEMKYLNHIEYPIFYEPFDLLFEELYQFGKHYHLGAKQYDEISTELIHNKPFCIHTWYSRGYETDPFHFDRINKAYQYAKDKCKL